MNAPSEPNTPDDRPDAVVDLLSFIEACPTPWHAVQECVERLEGAGYRALDEGELWKLSAGDKIYVVRGGASVAAFEIGAKTPPETGFRLVGAHTDSPNLRLKPRATTDNSGLAQLAVAPYGGVLLYTWLDRDLSLAGRVTLGTDAGLQTRLVRFDGPIARLPSLAIHLDRKVNDEGPRLNKQQHLSPVWALAGEENPELESVIFERLKATGELPEGPCTLLGHELCFFDAVPPTLGGLRSEFIHAPRLDNLASCHAGLSALLSAEGPCDTTRGIVFYDHEECGSRSAQGADSPFLPELLRRITESLSPEAQSFERAMSRSFMVSADMAHAVHPNYSDRHEPGHGPRLGAGPVIKTNVNQRYATSGETAARFEACCRAADVIPQHFVTRSDLACGSTIGPISAGRLGIATVDVGNPMLSMHSCREMAAAADVVPMIESLKVHLAGGGWSGD